ncbi:MAG: Trp family transcriptional regulator [Eubacteriales bacterium]
MCLSVWSVAHMLSNNCAYSDVVAKTGASTATISRSESLSAMAATDVNWYWKIAKRREEATSW